jgi:hypothetical protein
MYKAVSVIQLQKIAESIRDKYTLIKPTYTVDLPNGGKQVYDYDEESIADNATPQADKEMWAEYHNQYNLMQNEVNEKTSAYLFYAGIDCEISDEWQEEQKWLEIELPKNKFDLKVRYITTELLRTPEQIKIAIAEIMKLSIKGVDQSAIKAAEGTFPGIV